MHLYNFFISTFSFSRHLNTFESVVFFKPLNQSLLLRMEGSSILFSALFRSSLCIVKPLLAKVCLWSLQNINRLLGNVEAWTNRAWSLHYHITSFLNRSTLESVCIFKKWHTAQRTLIQDVNSVCGRHLRGFLPPTTGLPSASATSHNVTLIWTQCSKCVHLKSQTIPIPWHCWIWWPHSFSCGWN